MALRQGNSCLLLSVALSACVGAEARPPTAGAKPHAALPEANGRTPGETLAGARTPALAPVRPRELQVTSGSIVAGAAEQFGIRSPTLRAELGTTPRSAAEIEFVYRGPTQTDAPLSSGELRRQIGLKLRAQNTCNVVYVMWHIEPARGIVVSVKNNPGQTRHAECGAGGYSFLEPLQAEPVAPIRVGEPHVLSAAITGDELHVEADGVRSWTGRLPPSVFTFDGPVGLRSDNGDFDVTLRAAVAPVK
jgi:hypothetical protein